MNENNTQLSQAKNENTSQLEQIRLELLRVMAPLDHAIMCDSDQGEDLDECDCWKATMTAEINRLLEAA